MNCYFNNVLYSSFNGMASLAPSVDHAIGQLKYFYQLQKPIFFLIGIYFIIQGVLYFKNFRKESFKGSFPKVNLFVWRKPLLQWDFDINLYGLIISTLTIYFLLGRNYGQFMGYLFQLMSPFFILYIFNCLYTQKFMIFVSMPLIIATLFTVSSIFPKNFHEFDNNWKTVDGLIKANNNIFATPLLVPLLIKYNRPVYDSGHSEYFHFGETQKILNFTFPSPPEIESRTEDQWDKVWTMVTQKKFDFLIMYSNYHPFMSKLCTLYYRPIGTIKLGYFHYSNSDDYVILVPR